MGSEIHHYDVFISHDRQHKDWAGQLSSELELLGLTVFLDQKDIESAASFPLEISHALGRSRYLALLISQDSMRPWVELEWSAFMAAHGPLHRIIPVLLENCELPTLLAPIQRIQALDRNAENVALEMAKVVGRPSELKQGDARRLSFGQDLVFFLKCRDGVCEKWDSGGRHQRRDAPWLVDPSFQGNLALFRRLTRLGLSSQGEGSELVTCAKVVGSRLFQFIFDDEAAEGLAELMAWGRERPLVTIRSDDEHVLSLPWELLFYDGEFLVRENRIDIARSIASYTSVPGPGAPARDHLKLVVNVSAPIGSRLDYESESYRISRALADQCLIVPTELGTVEDLVETVRAESPTGIHFSGHGAPELLVFEDARGMADPVATRDVIRKLKSRLPGKLPSLFFLASCHGLDSRGSTDESASSGELGHGSAAQIHKEGFSQVVAYFGPIIDELSTRAEVAFYRALAEGENTRYAIRQARDALARPFDGFRAPHRPAAAVQARESTNAIEHSHPFAWSQIVLFKSPSDFPLSLPSESGIRVMEPLPRRSYMRIGTRRVLRRGFVGRRREQHEIRRRLHKGHRVFLFHGLGGLGKTTMATHMASTFFKPDSVFPLWCHNLTLRAGVETQLLDQLWEGIRQRIGARALENLLLEEERQGESVDTTRRLSRWLSFLEEEKTEVVLYLDNLESLFFPPAQAGSDFAEWRSEGLREIWETMLEFAEQASSPFFLICSSRYINSSMPERYLFPLPPLTPEAAFRMVGWLPALRHLSLTVRERLVRQLGSHPRSIEYANDLVQGTLDRRESRGQGWAGGTSEEEWESLIVPSLPELRGKIEDDLLLQEIWDHILDSGARRMLFRMLLLKFDRWMWEFFSLLGDEGDSQEGALEIGARLRKTSLIDTYDLPVGPDEKQELRRYYAIHPATAVFVQKTFPRSVSSQELDEISSEFHRRVGLFLQGLSSLSHMESAFPSYALDAAHHLIEGGAYSQALSFAESVRKKLVDRGHASSLVEVFERLLAADSAENLSQGEMGLLYGNLGIVHNHLSVFDQADAYLEKALGLAEKEGDYRMVSHHLDHMGNVLLNRKEFRAATDYYKRSLEVSRHAGRTDIAVTLSNLGAAYMNLGDSEKALEYLEEISQTGLWSEGYDAANLFANLGSLHLREGSREKGIEFTERGLEMARQVGNRRVELILSRNLARVLEGNGDSAGASAAYSEIIRLARELKEDQSLVEAQRGLALIRGAKQDAAGAIALLLEALETARRMKSAEEEGKCLLQLGLLYYEANHWEEARRVFRGLSALDALSSKLRLLALGCLGDACRKLGALEEQLESYEQARVVAREAGDSREAIKNGLNIGSGHFSAGAHDRAIEAWTSALEEAEDAEDLEMQGALRRNLSALHVSLGDIVEAEKELLEALSLANTRVDLDAKQECLERLLNLASRLGDREKVASHSHSLLALYREKGEDRRVCEILHNLGIHYFEVGDLASSSNHLAELIELATACGELDLENAGLWILSRVRWREKSTKEEIELLTRLVDRLPPSENPKFEVDVVRNLGRAYLASGNFDVAIPYLKSALESSRDVDSEAEIQCLVNLGATYLGLDNFGTAIEYLLQSLRLAREKNDLRVVARGLANLGQAYLGIDEPDRARESLASSLEVAEQLSDSATVTFVSALLADLE